MSGNWSETQHLGLPPIYDTESKKPHWFGWRWLAGALFVAVMLAGFARGVDALGPSHGSPWYCWSEQGVQQCAPRVPFWFIQGTT